MQNEINENIKNNIELVNIVKDQKVFDENKFNKIINFENKKLDYNLLTNNQSTYIVRYLIDALENNIEGDVVELGCYLGESGKYLQKTLFEYNSNKKLYLYDSFQGLPEKTEYEEKTFWNSGGFESSEDIVIKNFLDNKLPLPIIGKYWFKEIPEDKLPDKICFAFLDGDFYTSIFDSLLKIYDKIETGGYILFHDYDRFDLPGVKAAITDFFKLINKDYKIIKVCSELAVIQKNQDVKKLSLPNDDVHLLDIKNKLNILSKEDREKLIEHLSNYKDINITNNDLTVVTGLWNIGRPGRDFSHYIEHFKNFLRIPIKMFIYIPKEYEYLVWENGIRNTSNTVVKIFELSDIKNLYSPHWDNTQKIRLDENWKNQTGEYGWLTSSPQAKLEWYNPIVQSKMFLLNDVTIWNPFSTEYFIWLDAGITNTVFENYFINEKVLDNINSHLDSFLFLSYPYEAVDEIHGFDFKKMNKFAGTKVKYVCRGGLFGGRRQNINQANAEYYQLLQNTLLDGCMGTEESIFAIMAHLYPEKYRRYALDSNGLIIKFIQALNENNVTLEEIPEKNIKFYKKNVDVKKLKVSIYMLTFNFPHQVEHTINTWLKHPKWFTDTRNILIDNSTNDEARQKNAEICKKYNIEHIITNDNTGINGGRFRAAQHFQESDSDYYLFLEDDMTLHEPNETLCRNGFRTYVPNLYDVCLKIIDSSDIDFLKLSYTEVYMDNNIQVSWYNVPQHIRSRDWPEYDKLPTTGLDPNAPRTKFKNIEVIDGTSYITGEIYYANWPMIVGKKGNQKMFLDTTWANPYEQTWMSYMYQETVEGNLKPAVLLASPINHNRIAHYKPEERREN